MQSVVGTPVNEEEKTTTLEQDLNELMTTKISTPEELLKNARDKDVVSNALNETKVHLNAELILDTSLYCTGGSCQGRRQFFNKTRAR